MVNPKQHKVPFNWQRAIVSYLFAVGISIYANAIFWGHLDAIEHPNAFWLKVGLLFVVDLVAFVLVTWHLFALAGFTRGYCFFAAALQLVLMLVHAGAVAKYDASVNQNRATIQVIADGQAKIAGAEAEGKMKGATQGAIQANARGQRGLATQITHCIQIGEIVEDQLDPNGDLKFVIYGESIGEIEMGVVTKWNEERSAVVITAFLLEITDYD